VPRRPAKQAPDDVAAAGVGEDRPVRERGHHRPHVVGDHPVAHRLLAAVGHPAPLRHPVDDGAEGVGGVEVLDVLHDGGDAVKPHAGVDVLLRQGLEHPLPRNRPGAVVLGEDQVPDLDEAVTGAGVRPGLVRGAELGAAVIKDLARGAAGAVRPLGDRVRRPEVLVFAEALDALFRHAHHVAPDRVGLVVVLEDRHPKPLGVETEPALVGQKLPGPQDRLFLEVVAEGEVAEHLEVGVVGCGRRSRCRRRGGTPGRWRPAGARPRGRGRPASPP